MIEVKEITKYYGIGESRFQVLKGISLEIKDGDFTVILGGFCIHYNNISIISLILYSFSYSKFFSFNSL